jgi:hypothetical protein
VTPVPAIPVVAALTVYCPAVVGSVQPPSVATPDEFVDCNAPVSVPPPLVLVNVTATSGTGLPLASFTTTDGRVATAVFTVA